MRYVLCFGDSNTHGTPPRPEPWHLDRMPLEQRWPSVASAVLGADWTLIAEGQPGRTTVHPDPTEGGFKSGAAALPILLESHRPLDVVVVMLGTNDLKQRFSTSATDVAIGVERLIDCIRNSRAGPEGHAPLCLVVSPVPLVEVGIFSQIFRGAADSSARLAEALATMTERRGVAFVDAGTVARTDPADGVHLDPDAHDAIGRLVAGKLREMLG